MRLLTRFKFYLWYFGHFKVPMIGYAKPRLISISDQSVMVQLPLSRHNKNHLQSMYFGALSIGADLAGGLHALYYAKQSNLRLSFAFKSFQAQFVKRAESDVYFVSDMGETVKHMINAAQHSLQRVNQNIVVKAYTQGHDQLEEVAHFVLELSIKII